MPTNFDLLKEHLTPAELAEYICEDQYMNKCCHCAYDCERCGYECLHGVIRWLVSEVKS